MRVAFIVDGFNVYHSLKAAEGRASGRSLRWLDLHGLCATLLSSVFGPGAALKMDLDRQRKRLASAGASDDIAEVARGVVKGAWGVFFLGMLAAASGINLPEGLVIGSMLFGALTGVVGGVVVVWLERRRTQLQGRRWLAFWESWLGEWTVKLAGVGLRRLPPEPERAALPSPAKAPTLGDVVQWSGSCVWRGWTHLEASAATREREGRSPTQEELEMEQKLQAKLAELDARRAKLQSLDETSTEPGSLTRDIEAAWEVCKVVDALLEGREWRL